MRAPCQMSDCRAATDARLDSTKMHANAHSFSRASEALAFELTLPTLGDTSATKSFLSSAADDMPFFHTVSAGHFTFVLHQECKKRVVWAHLTLAPHLTCSIHQGKAEVHQEREYSCSTARTAHFAMHHCSASIPWLTPRATVRVVRSDNSRQKKFVAFFKVYRNITRLSKLQRANRTDDELDVIRQSIPRNTGQKNEMSITNVASRKALILMNQSL